MWHLKWDIETRNKLNISKVEEETESRSVIERAVTGSFVCASSYIGSTEWSVETVGNIVWRAEMLKPQYQSFGATSGGIALW